MKHYKKNHDLAPHERIANLRAAGTTLDLIKNYKEKQEGIITYKLVNTMSTSKSLIKGYVLNGDKTNSPSLDYLKGMKGTENSKYVGVSEFHDDSIPYEDRLLYGLELSSNEYNNLFETVKEHL